MSICYYKTIPNLIIAINMFQCIFFIFFTLPTLGQGQQTGDGFYQLFSDNSAITDVQPFIETVVNTEIECFLQAMRDLNKPEFIQIKTVSVSEYLCSLFNITTSEGLRTYKTTRSQVYTLLSKYDKRVNTKSTSRDCMEWFNRGFETDGVYKIKINNIKKDVYCNMTGGGGGWTVVQKRFDGSVDFDRTWREYRDGFGDVNGEYWLGNELIFLLTKGRNNEIRLTGTSFSGETRYIIADGFMLEDENNKYKLHSGGKKYDSWDLYKDWKSHNLKEFSTWDSDKDGLINNVCADKFHCGWWFQSCRRISPNGVYSHDGSLRRNRGIIWRKWWSNDEESLKEFEIAIKSTN